MTNRNPYRKGVQKIYFAHWTEFIINACLPHDYNLKQKVQAYLEEEVLLLLSQNF